MTDNPDDTARVIYLVVLIVMLIGYFGSNIRSRISENLKTVAMWMLIFMASITAFSFRDVIDRELLGRAVLGSGDAGGKVVATTPVPDRGDVIVVQRRKDGHFYMVLLANGKEIEFVVNFSVPDIVLSQDDARLVGINMQRLNYSRVARFPDGIFAIADVQIESLDAPGFVLRDVAASVGGAEVVKSALGSNYLDRYSKVAVHINRMVLTP